MEGFALLLGHLVGDYIIQNDWMAKNKTNPFAAEAPLRPESMGVPAEKYSELEDQWIRDLGVWRIKHDAAKLGNTACTVHCFFYTLAVIVFAISWIHWWGVLLCFAVHWPVDRFRLARWWMNNVAGQKDFVSGPLSPWSVIVVDNTFHLLTLYAIWQLS